MTAYSPENTALYVSPTVLVVTVNYRSAAFAVESLRSLENEAKSLEKLQVVVVDNDSGDESVKIIGQAIAENNWKDWVTLSPSNHNGGYAYGNNYAIRPALKAEHPPDYFLLLNPDTQIYPGAVKELLDFMESNPQAGICGSSLEEADGSPFGVAFRFPSILSELEGGLRLGIVSKLLSKWKVPQQVEACAQEVDWLSGACLMIRREVFETIGLMDEDYFLYFEETDFCLQAKRAGWTCWYVPESHVIHIAGQSTGVTVRTDKPKRKPTYCYETKQRYFTKNHCLFYTMLANFTLVIEFSLWRTRRCIQAKPDNDPPQLLCDFYRNSTIKSFINSKMNKLTQINKLRASFQSKS